MPELGQIAAKAVKAQLEKLGQKNAQLKRGVARALLCLTKCRGLDNYAIACINIMSTLTKSIRIRNKDEEVPCIIIELTNPILMLGEPGVEVVELQKLLEEIIKQPDTLQDYLVKKFNSSAHYLHDPKYFRVGDFMLAAADMAAIGYSKLEEFNLECSPDYGLLRQAIIEYYQQRGYTVKEDENGEKYFKPHPPSPY